jgi:hypothetical protein
VSLVIALLLGIQVRTSTVTFQFRSAPPTIRAAYQRGPLVECGSGRTVALRGSVHLVIHFLPAQTALSFARQRRLKGQGAFRELAKVCDFESDLAWAIGLDRRRSFRVERHGTRVTIRLT